MDDPPLQLLLPLMLRNTQSPPRKGWLWLYRLCLYLYPSSFRRAYGKEMQILFNDSLRDAGREGAGAMAVLWLYILSDIGKSAIRAHLEEWTTMNQPYTRTNQIGAASAFIAVGLVTAVWFLLPPMSVGHLGTLVLLMICLLKMMTALHRRLHHVGTPRLATVGYGVGMAGSVMMGGGVLMTLGSGAGLNGIFVLGIIFGFLLMLGAFGIVGVSAIARPVLGGWRFAPALALPLLIFIVGASAFATSSQIEHFYLYELQALLFVATIGGTGLLLWTSQR